MRAKEEAADAFIEEMQDISDSSAEIVGDGHDAARINAARLRVDTRKWIASKLKPKKYGEQVNVKSEAQITIQITHAQALLANQAAELDEPTDDIIIPKLSS